jgi:hypothetical protein
LLVKPVEGAGELRAEQSEVSFDALRAADHHMIGAWKALGWHDFAGESTKAPLHAVADDGSTDLSCDRESHAHRGIGVLPIADEKDEAGRRGSLAGIRGKEVGAPGDSA